jgi:hypothetical protein
MKRISFLLVFGAIFLLAANPLHGLEESIQKPTRIGVGVTIGKELGYFDEGELFTLPIGFSNIYVPIIMQSKFRLEPELGLFRYSYSSENGFEYSTSYSSWRFGLGIFPLVPKGKVNLYYGARFGIILSSETEESDGDKEDYSKTDWYIGPSVGAEYFFTDHLSLGGEAQINFIFLGRWENGDADDIDRSESVITNRVLVVLRWYY